MDKKQKKTTHESNATNKVDRMMHKNTLTLKQFWLELIFQLKKSNEKLWTR